MKRALFVFVLVLAVFVSCWGGLALVATMGAW